MGDRAPGIAGTAQHSGVGFEKVTGAVGAIVHGVDPADGYAEANSKDLVEALHIYGVLFFHSRERILLDRYKSFASSFGELRMPGSPPGSAKGESTTAVDSVTNPAELYRTNCWHTDGAWEVRPPQAALLTPEVLPQVGGDTMWSSMYAAWDGLSSRYQSFVDGLDAVHSKAAFLRHLSSDADLSTISRGRPGEPTQHIHPVVLRDPITNRKMLYVNSNWTERILGLSSSESDKLIQTLCELVNTPEFHVRLRWQPNMVAVWEQRVTQHRAISDYTGHRKLIRISIAGDRPSG